MPEVGRGMLMRATALTRPGRYRLLMERSVRYCLECGWRIRSADHEDPSALMIDHAIATGHDLDSGIESSEEGTSRPVDTFPFGYRR